MAKQKKKIRKRKRPFNLQTAEGRQLAMDNVKLFNAFPEKEKRRNYLTAMIEELDRMIAQFPVAV
jgi:hypothetical protein